MKPHIEAKIAWIKITMRFRPCPKLLQICNFGKVRFVGCVPFESEFPKQAKFLKKLYVWTLIVKGEAGGGLPLRLMRKVDPFVSPRLLGYRDGINEAGHGEEGRRSLDIEDKAPNASS